MEDQSAYLSEISQRRIAQLYPALQNQAVLVLQNMFMITGRKMNVVESLRSFDYQFTLYQKGRQLIDHQWKVLDPSKIVTNARPGLSFHCYGLAFDCAFAGNDPYLELIPRYEQIQMWKKYGEIVSAHGLSWGGNFKLKSGSNDRPHAENSFGLSIVECLELYQQGGVPAVWAHIDEIRAS